MLPSKKILVAFSIIVVGFGGIFVYGYLNNKSQIDYNSSTLSILGAPSDSPESKKDSDNDGMLDWQEALYGTDPKNPDTDGDGTLDGKEIELNRNPLIKGPKDFLVKEETKATTTLTKENLTLTDTFARNFFIQYIELKRSGTEVTPENVDVLAKEYLQNTKFPEITPKIYKASNIILIDTTNQSIKNYHESLQAIFDRYWPEGTSNELTVFQQAFVYNKPTALDKLEPIIAKYQLVLNNSVNLAVPKLAVSLHLNMINALSAYIETLKMIQLSFSDPVSGLVGLNAYQNSRANIFVTLTNMKMYFINSLK